MRRAACFNSSIGRTVAAAPRNPLQWRILLDDTVEMVRAIRNRHYEETKHMTCDEKRAYEQKKVDNFKKLMKGVNPADYDFSWLHKKSESQS